MFFFLAMIAPNLKEPKYSIYNVRFQITSPFSRKIFQEPIVGNSKVICVCDVLEQGKRCYSTNATYDKANRILWIFVSLSYK